MNNFKIVCGINPEEEVIIAKARQDGYLNTWSIQKLCRDFKFGYWEA